MRPRLVLFALTALTLALALAGCARDGMDRSYAGSPGSTYNSVGNPPQARGVATYDATSPLTPRDYGNGGDHAALSR